MIGLVRSQLRRMAAVEASLPPSIETLTAFIRAQKGSPVERIGAIFKRFSVTVDDLRDLAGLAREELQRRQSAAADLT